MAKKGVKSNRNSAAGRIAQNGVLPRQIPQMYRMISGALYRIPIEAPGEVPGEAPGEVPSEVPSGGLAHFDRAGGQFTNKLGSIIGASVHIADDLACINRHIAGAGG